MPWGNVAPTMTMNVSAATSATKGNWTFRNTGTAVNLILLDLRTARDSLTLT